jgi:hypothetical protein
MANAVKAYISERSARVSVLGAYGNRDGFDAREAKDEATRILAATEPSQHHPMLGPGYWTLYEIGEQYPNTSPMSDAGSDLAADIKDMLSELDELAHDCAPEVYGGNMSMLDMMIRNERVNA